MLEKRIFGEESWKVLSVASFLFVTIFFVLPYLIQVSTYFHEKGHQDALDKYDVENSYSFNLLNTIPNFYSPRVSKLGVTKFDLKNYNNLSPNNKTQINMAGVISDLRFLFLIGMFLVCTNIYLYYKIRYKKETDLSWVLAMNWVLFMWLLALIQITVANITYSSGDLHQLIKSVSGL